MLRTSCSSCVGSNPFNAPVKFFCPHPPRAPPEISFFCCCPGVLITLIFTCPALYNHQNHPFFECPALFYHTHIFSDPGAAPGGMGTEHFDRRIMQLQLGEALQTRPNQTKSTWHQDRGFAGDINIDNITLDFNKKSSPWKQDSLAVLNPKHSPIPNSGEQSVPSNYQGIAPTSLFAKVVNKMILMTFTDFSKAFDNIGHYTMLKTHKA